RAARRASGARVTRGRGDHGRRPLPTRRGFGNDDPHHDPHRAPGGLAVSALSAWANFYVIVGSAAAALIGVQFVVIALIANMRRLATAESIRAFGTPTVVHLGGALVVSALMSAPWHSLSRASIALATCGLGGLAY